MTNEFTVLPKRFTPAINSAYVTSRSSVLTATLWPRPSARCRSINSSAILNGLGKPSCGIPTSSSSLRNSNCVVTPSSLLCQLARIFHLVIAHELYVVEFAIHFLNAANVDILDDVTRVRVDRDRSARTFPGHAFHRVDERVAVGRALCLFTGFGGT